MSRTVLDDLRAPVLTEEQATLLGRAEANPPALTVEALEAVAVERTGLDDFGAADYRERAALIFDELGSDPNATELLKQTVFDRMSRAVTTRVLVVDFLRRHPEVHEQRLERPIVVTGLLRSGTTHLLNLLAADQRFQALPYWLSLEPVPAPGERVGPDGVDPRYARTEAAWQHLQRINPHQAKHHHMGPDDIQEDIYLQMPDVASYVWELAYKGPRYRDHYLSHDQTPHYEYAKTIMKAIQLQRATDKPWVLKCPQHFEQLVPLMNVYPDALVVFNHRDPVATLASLITVRSYAARTRQKQIDLEEGIEDAIALVDRLVAAYLCDVDRIPPEQRFDVPFGEFMRDDVAMVGRLYHAAGLDMTDEARAQLDAFMQSHRRGQFGQLDYNLRRDFGIDTNALRERYSAYFDRHPGIQVEER